MRAALLSLILSIAYLKLDGQPISGGEAPKGRHESLAGIALGKSTVEDVRKRFGEAPPEKSVRDGIVRFEMCYITSKGATLAFQSKRAASSELLDGFRVVAKVSVPTTRRCVHSAVLTGAPATDGGLRLGLSRRALIKILGKPSKAGQEFLQFQYESTLPMTAEEIDQQAKTFGTKPKRAYWDVLDTIEVHLKDAKVVAFEVSRAISY